jgi:hypothetical protein
MQVGGVWRTARHQLGCSNRRRLCPLGRGGCLPWLSPGRKRVAEQAHGDHRAWEAEWNTWRLTVRSRCTASAHRSAEGRVPASGRRPCQAQAIGRTTEMIRGSSLARKPVPTCRVSGARIALAQSRELGSGRVFAATREAINDRGFHTRAQIFAEMTATMPLVEPSRIRRKLNLRTGSLNPRGGSQTHSPHQLTTRRTRKRDLFEGGVVCVVDATSLA